MQTFPATNKVKMQTFTACYVIVNINKYSRVEHHFGHLFPSRVFGDVFKGDPFPLLVPSDVILLVFWGVTVIWSSRRFLLDLKPSVYIIREEPHLSILFGEMEHFMNLEDAIP